MSARHRLLHIMVAGASASGCTPAASVSPIVPVAQPPAEADTTAEADTAVEADGILDVVTWNIETFPKSGQATASAVAEIMLAMDADLFALQEISNIEAFDLMIAEMPGWSGYVESEWYAGLAYLYRSDTIEVVDNYEIYTTEPFWSPFPRSPQVMELRFQGQEFVVINNHFKCCGDGVLEQDDTQDEEARRLEATNLLKDYIDTHLSGRRVIVLGDLNDSLTDAIEDNVFASLLEDADRYRFADMDIATGDAAAWSYPTYPSHIDHILVTDPLFAGLASAEVASVAVDADFFDGWAAYEELVSDHRPVVMRIPLTE